MGIMGLQSLNFKRLTFKYGFSLFYLSLLVILYCLSFTWSQGYAAEVSLYSIDNRAFASHVLNAQRRLFSGRLFPHYQVDLTSHQFKIESVHHTAALVAMGTCWHLVSNRDLLLAAEDLTWSALPIEKETKLQVSLLVGDL